MKQLFIFLTFCSIFLTCSNTSKKGNEEHPLQVSNLPIYTLDTILKHASQPINIDFTDAVGSWFYLKIEGEDTIVYNYPNLDIEDFVVPNSYRLTKDSLTITFFSEAPYSYAIDTVWIQEGEFFFPIGNKYSFRLIDKERRIGQWVDYYGRKHWNDTLSISLCIDSAYNKYPILDYVDSSIGTFSMDD